MHKSEVFFYLILAFLAGIFVASLVSDAPTTALVLFLIGVIIVAVSGYHKTFAWSKKAQLYREVGVLVGIAVLVFGVGMVRFGYFSSSHGVLDEFAQHQVKEKGITITLNGYVDDEETISSSGKGQIVFRATSLISDDRIIATDERTLITADPYPMYEVGRKLTVSGALDMPQNFSDFDYVQYLKNKNIRTTMTYPHIADDPGLSLGFGDRFKVGLFGRLFFIKNTFERAISRSIPAPSAAYINGVLLGTRTDIPADLTDAFNKTSTTHILAISGYNITIIADALLAVLILIMRRRKALWVVAVVIILFTILTGASASVVRAAIMGLLLLYASGYGRLYDATNSLLLAAAVMVYLNPFILRFDVGFQLSFLAVIGLIYIYPILNQRLKRVSTVGGLKESLLMTASAQVLVFPLLMYYFHQLSLIALPANMLVLPLMPHIMLLGFLTGIGGLFWLPLGRLIGLAAWALASYQLAVIRWLASLPFSAIDISVHWITLAAIYALIIFGTWKMGSGSDV